MDPDLKKHINLWLDALDVDADERPQLAVTLTQMCEYFFKLGKLAK